MVLSFSWRGFPLVLRGPWPRRQGTGAFAPYPLGRARRPPKENGRIAGGLKTKQPGNDKGLLNGSEQRPSLLLGYGPRRPRPAWCPFPAGAPV